MYLDSEASVEDLQAYIDRKEKPCEIPASQRRPLPVTLEYCEQHYQIRHHVIVEAYRCGGFALKRIGEHFGLHYSTMGGIPSNHKSKT